jgi:hypothetical protein
MSDPINYQTWRRVFPRVEDTLKLLDYRSSGKSQFVYVRNIEISEYEYVTEDPIVAGTPSPYASNQINSLQPNDGHLYLVLPTVQPDDVLADLTPPTVATGTTYTNVNSFNPAGGGDYNTRVLQLGVNGTTDNFIVGRESLRVQLKQPAQTPWWGLDQLSDSGPIDWLVSSPEFPNPAFMWAVTDVQKVGTIQMQFTMPEGNLLSENTTGVYGRVRFYIGFVEYLPMTPKQVGTGPYTPIPTMPPAQGQPSLPSPGYQAQAEASYQSNIRAQGY